MMAEEEKSLIEKIKEENPDLAEIIECLGDLENDSVEAIIERLVEKEFLSISYKLEELDDN